MVNTGKTFYQSSQRDTLLSVRTITSFRDEPLVAIQERIIKMSFTNNKVLYEPALACSFVSLQQCIWMKIFEVVPCNPKIWAKGFFLQKICILILRQVYVILNYLMRLNYLFETLLVVQNFIVGITLKMFYNSILRRTFLEVMKRDDLTISSIKWIYRSSFFTQYFAMSFRVYWSSCQLSVHKIATTFLVRADKTSELLQLWTLTAAMIIAFLTMQFQIAPTWRKKCWYGDYFEKHLNKNQFRNSVHQKLVIKSVAV